MVRRSGFTLIELLTVIGVIMLLLAITFPAFTRMRTSQKIRSTKAVVETLTMAAANYANDYGVYPAAEYAPDGANRGNRSLVTLLDARGGRSWPYLPSAFYGRDQRLKDDLLLDLWDRPFIYFDSSVMKEGTSHTYDILGDPAVSPAKDDEAYHNFGRCQIWSCGPNERNDGGLDLHTKEADDLANFEVVKPD